MTIDPIAKLLGEWSAHISIGAIFLRLTLSVLLSAIIGCERSSKRHSAGLRTFIVVSLASTMAVMIDMFLAEALGFRHALLSASSIIAVAILSSNSILFTSKSKMVEMLNKTYSEAETYTKEVIFFVEQVTGHIIPDFRYALKYGIDEMIQEANKKQGEFFEAAAIALGGVKILADRYIEIIRNLKNPIL